MRILLVEDEAPKRANIRHLLAQMHLDSTISEARSVGSAIRLLRETAFQLILLDMSLPTFDIGAGESGGRPQGFGGVEVLRYMDRFKIHTPTIVITAFEAFADGAKHLNLSSLGDTLATDHPHTFKGLVFYNSMFTTWRDDLRERVFEVGAS